MVIGQDVDHGQREWLETIGFHTKRFVTKVRGPRYRNMSIRLNF